jgi:hypothetical protein
MVSTCPFVYDISSEVNVSFVEVRDRRASHASNVAGRKERWKLRRRVLLSRLILRGHKSSASRSPKVLVHLLPFKSFLKLGIRKPVRPCAGERNDHVITIGREVIGGTLRSRRVFEESTE